MKNKFKKTPFIGTVLLRFFLPESDREFLLEDFGTVYNEKRELKGRFSAWFWYWGQVFKTAPQFIGHSSKRSIDMFWSYFKIAFRNLKRQKTYSFINIGGLAIGLACCSLIYIYILFEMSYDKYHKDSGQIYRITYQLDDEGIKTKLNSLPEFDSSLILEQCPEIENIANINTMTSAIFANGDIKFPERSITFADGSIFDIFTIPFILGTPSSSLSEPFSMVISEKMAQKYFGDDDPLGKILKFTSGRLSNYFDFGSHLFTITGVIENVPANSTYQYDFIASLQSLPGILENQRVRFENSRGFNTFVSVKQGAQVGLIETRLNAVLKDEIMKNMGESSLTIPGKEIVLFKDVGGKIILQRLTEIHLDNKTRVNVLYIFSAVALLIILIACINYMNLSTARFSRRFREVGLKKAVGAQRSQLIKQFLGESVFMSFSALLVSLFLVKLFLPLFSDITGRQLAAESINEWKLFAGLVMITLFVGIISGSYPALFLSSFKPSEILSGRKIFKRSKFSLRKGLVVVQFTMTVFLIIGTITISRQLNFILNEDIGFKKENVLVLSINDKSLRSKVDALKSELANHRGISSITSSFTLPMDGLYFPRKAYLENNKDREFELALLSIDENFFNTFGIKLLQGNNFSGQFQRRKEFVISELTAKRLGLGNPVGSMLTFDGYQGRIIGIVKDFFVYPKRYEHHPAVFYVHPGMHREISLKIIPEETESVLAHIRNVWSKFSPDRPVEFNFFEDVIDREYRTENRMGLIFRYSTILGIFIACLGLLGLVSFIVEQRTKEIGVRKVLGASVSNIISLVSKEFLILVAFANLLAVPAAYYFINRWLQDFAYSINVGFGIFLAALVISILTAFITISFQAVKAALANPVDSLKNE